MWKTFLFQAIRFIQTVIVQLIQFSICTDFVYTQLNINSPDFRIIHKNYIYIKRKFVWFGWCNSMSTIVGYSMRNPFFTHLLNIWSVRTVWWYRVKWSNNSISSNSIQHKSTKLNGSNYCYIYITDNSINHQLFVYTLLNVIIFLFQAIQFSISHLFAHSLIVWQFCSTNRLNPIRCCHSVSVCTGERWGTYTFPKVPVLQEPHYQIV